MIAHMDAPLPRCATTTRPLRNVRRHLRQPARDVLVRQPVKSVAAHAFLVEALWQRVAVGNFGMAAMKRRVEAGDLRKLRLSLQQRADRAEIVRLMERRERRESLKPLEHNIVDESRLAEVRAAMHYTMTHRDR